MSALTKVFVVLLVILSLLLAAASVTILNVVPSYSTEIETVSAARDTAVARANQLESAGGAQAQTLQAQRDELSNQLNDAQQAVAQLRTQLAAAEADKAQVQAQLTAAQNTVAIATSALDANQQNVQQLQQQVATLRDEANTSLTQYAQTQSALAETQNEFTYARQELRQVKERNQELLSRSEELERTVVALGGDPAGDLNRVAPPAINAVVIETLRLANEPYASISVGREDDVRPGQEFAVFSQDSNQFLGFLTIVDTEDAEAFGKLRGPNIGQIRADDVVRTSASAGR